MAAEEAFEESLVNILRGDTQHVDVPVDVPIQTDFVPITKRTVAYIVCGLVFNDKGEILMVQEAKMSCYGLWYLPAGRMERGESLLEAVKREVLEEAGIEFEPKTLVSVEVASGYWYRFTFIGRAAGGDLKTLDQQDKESLQADWYSPQQILRGDEEVPLRAPDIQDLIQLGLEYRRSAQPPHQNLLPVPKPHRDLLLRLCLVSRHGNDKHILISTDPQLHVPTGMISDSDKSIKITVSRMLRQIFGSKCDFDPEPIGTLGVEYFSSKLIRRWGTVLTILMRLPPDQKDLPQVHHGANYRWLKLKTANAKTVLGQKLEPGKCVPLMLLR